MDQIFKKLALVGDIWVLWILLGASIVSLGVVFERWWKFRKSQIDFPKFLKDLNRKLDADDLAGARQLARSIRAVEAHITLAGLNHTSRGKESVEETMTAQLVYERSQLEKNLIILGTLGNNAPFIGLFGTVLGIIKAFNDLAVTGSSGVSVVMAGISSALIATAFGILVAIPAVMANNYFQTRLRRVSSNTQTLIHTLQSYLKKHAAAESHREAEAALS
ncbi:MAG: Protein TolQ [Elusimicrobia bacterium]|nr:Protein TolQ [Elusimicrobiota bacterium]